MPTIETAIILAAGRGRRLLELSLEKPKPMTAINNVTIIENLIDKIVNSNIKRVIVVIGYHADKLKKHISEQFSEKAELIFIENEIYETTNNIYSLYLAKEYMNNGFYLFEADVFCENGVVKDLVDNKNENIICIDGFTDEMNGTVVELNENSFVKQMFLNKDQSEGFEFRNKFKTLNFYKLSKKLVEDFFIDRMESHINSKNVNSYYEWIIQEAINSGYLFYGQKAGNNKWWEIDTYEDLLKAESIFKEFKNSN